MIDQQRRASSPAGVRRASGLLLGLLLLSAMMARPVSADEAEHEPEVQQAPAAENTQERSPAPQQPASPQAAAPSAARNICEVLATTAVANELPVGFFVRLIWQESRFEPGAISPKGAQGIAQFMPGTARLSGLENPFDPFEAIQKSGQLLRDLRREFGNLGLAAAAYNAGSARVHDWLGGRRSLPRETLAYVRIVTGRSAQEWVAGEPTVLAGLSSAEAIRCDATVSGQANAATSVPKSESAKPWGVEIVGGTTPENALARYRDWRPKYETIVAGREPNVVIRGILGQAGAARVRLGEDSQADARKLCASLKAAGTYCDVMRN